MNSQNVIDGDGQNITQLQKGMMNWHSHNMTILKDVVLSVKELAHAKSLVYIPV